MKITINEVAKEAGVSITTVSRVLNNNYPVKRETREKIEKAIERLNYKPNAAARSLITKKTSTIGIIVPGITNLFFPTIVEAVGNVVKDKGYSISLSITGGDKLEEKKLVEDMAARQVDGIIVIDPCIENLTSNYYDECSNTMPIVIVNGAPYGRKCNFVCYDEEVGTREAFDYLIKLGHKKIAFLRGFKSFSYDIKEKIYKEVIQKNGFEYEKILNVGRGNSIEVVEKTQKELGKLLKEEYPTAIFACNDLMALGVINACRELNINIPKDISVIGFDNTVLAGTTHPRLTSVDLNMSKIGEKAALELIDLIENEIKIRKKIIMDTRLVIRDSCSKV